MKKFIILILLTICFSILISNNIFGDGFDGSLVVAETVYTDEIRSKVNQTSISGEPILYVENPDFFEPGQNIIIFQMKGASAGIYEENYIASIGESYIMLTNNLNHTFVVDEISKAQAVKINNYENVDIYSEGILTANVWNGETGGIVYFKVSGSLFNNGHITATGIGFSGSDGGVGGSGGNGGIGGSGEFFSSGYNPNSGGQFGNGGGSGGGGFSSPSYYFMGGGRGGSYGDNGNLGGNPQGINSSNLSNEPENFNFFVIGDGGLGGLGGDGGRGGGGGGGGGGGVGYDANNGGNGGAGGIGGTGGNGGSGGGIVFLKINELTGTGAISSNGTNGYPGSFGSNGSLGGNGAGGKCWNGLCGGGGGGGNGASGGNGGDGGNGGNGGIINLFIENNQFLGDYFVNGGAGGIGGTGGNGGSGGSGGGGHENGNPGSTGSLGNNGNNGIDGIDGIINLFLEGCTDELACNTSSNANIDDGSCEYESCAGCTDAESCNYDEEATLDDGSCSYDCIGNGENFFLGFDGGSNDDYVQIDGSDFSYGPNNFTIEAKVYFNSNGISNGGNGYGGIVSKSYWQDGVPYGYSLRRMPEDRIQFQIANLDNNGSTMILSDSYINNHTWYDVAIVRDQGNLKMYIDGELDFEWANIYDDPHYANLLQNMGLNSGDMYLGLANIHGCCPNGPNPEELDGYLDEVRFWDHALTQDQIQNNMETELSGNEIGLAAYYKMNSGDETYVYDYSGNQNHGTRYGTTLNTGGCTDSSACNYDEQAGLDDGSCEYESCAGCTDAGSCNYDGEATLDDGSCEYDSCAGCTDAESCNYDEEATLDDGSCLFTDCLGECGGTAIIYEENCVVPDIIVPDDYGTIQAAISDSFALDMIFVRNGTYSGTLNFYNKSLTIVGESQEGVNITFNASGNNLNYASFLYIDGSNLTISNINFVDSNGVISFIDVNAANGGISNLTMKNCSFMNNTISSTNGDYYSMIQIGSNSICLFDNVKFIDNYTARTCGFNCEYGFMYILDSDVTIKNSEFAGNYWGSSHNNNQLRGGLIYSTQCNLIIENTLISDNHIYGNATMRGGLIYFDRYSLDIINSTITNNTVSSDNTIGAIFYTSGNYSNINIENSIIYQETAVTPNVLIDVNINVNYSNILGGQNSFTYNNGTAFNWGDSNIDADPLFSDADNRDYTLQADSPCIDAGNPSSLLDADESIADMGAFYYHQNLVFGCTDELACNYDANANTENGICQYDSCYGCTDEAAQNYDETITQDDGSCIYGPSVISIYDAPEDQGGYVFVNWNANSLDVLPNDEITHYSVLRYVPNERGWELLDEIPALYEEDYTYLAPTIQTSVPDNGDIYETQYKVRAHTSDQTVFYDSDVSTGFSVDNIAPLAPQNLRSTSSDNSLSVKWDEAIDADFQYYTFMQKEASPVYTVDTLNTVEITNFYDEFYLQSTDIHDNISGLSDYMGAHDLKRGVNLVGFGVIPEDSDINNVIDCGDVYAIIGEGEAALCNQGQWQGSLDEINSDSGYWIKTHSGEILSTVGSKHINSTFDLHNGYNLISYTCDLSGDLNDLLGNNCSAITDVIGEGLAATCLDGPGWVGSLDKLSSNRGYWVKAVGAYDLNYDCPQDIVASRTQKVTEDIKNYVQSIDQAFYFFEDIENVEIGDRVESYCENTLVGSRIWNGPYMDIPAMGQDSQDETQGYCKEGMTPHFKLVKQSGEVFDLAGAIPAWENNRIFMLTDGMSIASVSPDEFGLSNIYPNPFNPSTTIDFAVPFESNVVISIYDISGKQIETLVSQTYFAGNHSVIWNAQNYSSGVYFVKMVSEGFVDSQKLMLVK